MMLKLNKCPFCGHEAVSISVYDIDEKWKGPLGCDFEKDPDCDIALYALHHEEWMSCVLRCDDQEEALGGLFFNSAEEAAKYWNEKTAMLNKS